MAPVTGPVDAGVRYRNVTIASTGSGATPVAGGRRVPPVLLSPVPTGPARHGVVAARPGGPGSARGQEASAEPRPG